MTDLVARSAPDPESADTERLYLGVALGSDRAEAVLTARWTKAGRTGDALAQLRSTARFGESDWRWSRIFFLEMRRGNCNGAYEALQALTAAAPSLDGYDAAFRTQRGDIEYPER